MKKYILMIEFIFSIYGIINMQKLLETVTNLITFDVTFINKASVQLY